MSYRSALGAAAAVAAAGVAIAGIGTPPPVRTPEPAAAVVPVTQVDLGCPAVPRRADTTVLAAAPSSLTAAAGALRVRSVPGHGGAPPLAETVRAGLLRRSVAPEAGTGLLVSAEGGLAPGTAAALSATPGDRRRAAGLSVGRCAPAMADWWFAGVDTRVGSTSRLSLTNASPAAAAVDLAFFAPRGVVNAAGSRGIAIPGRSQLSLNLASFAPGVDALTVHVSAQHGTASAAVHTTTVAGLTPVGADWVAPAAPPTTHLVVGPAVGTRGRQRLVLTNPGAREALAAIQILDAGGAFTPTQLTGVRVGPHAVVATDVTSILEGRPAAIRVVSNVALTGAVTTTERSGVPDFTTVGASSPLTTPAVVPLPPSRRAELLLTTADPGGASLRIGIFDRGGTRIRTDSVNLRGRTTTAWRLRRHDPAAYLVVSGQRGSAVHAVAYLRDEYGVGGLPVTSGTWSIREPVVQPTP